MSHPFVKIISYWRFFRDSKSGRASKPLYWFKSNGNFAEWVNFAYWWSCIGTECDMILAIFWISVLPSSKKENNFLIINCLCSQETRCYHKFPEPVYLFLLIQPYWKQTNRVLNKHGTRFNCIIFLIWLQKKTLNNTVYSLRIVSMFQNISANLKDKWSRYNITRK